MTQPSATAESSTATGRSWTDVQPEAEGRTVRPRIEAIEQRLGLTPAIANVANDTLLPLGGCLIVFFAAHIWKKHNLDEELSHGAPNYKGSFLQKYLNFAVGYLAPAVLGFIFIITVLKTYFGVDIF